MRGMSGSSRWPRRNPAPNGPAASPRHAGRCASGRQAGRAVGGDDRLPVDSLSLGHRVLGFHLVGAIATSAVVPLCSPTEIATLRVRPSSSYGLVAL
jgi:hypothetical protein